MITALVLGAGFSIGLRTLAVWLFPPRPALGAVLARSTTPPAPTPILATEDTGWAARLGRPFIAPLRALGLPGERLARDLAVIGRPVATHLAEKATLAIASIRATRRACSGSRPSTRGNAQTASPASTAPTTQPVATPASDPTAMARPIRSAGR